TDRSYYLTRLEDDLPIWEIERDFIDDLGRLVGHSDYPSVPLVLLLSRPLLLPSYALPRQGPVMHLRDCALQEPVEAYFHLASSVDSHLGVGCTHRQAVSVAHIHVHHPDMDTAL